MILSPTRITLSSFKELGVLAGIELHPIEPVLFSTIVASDDNGCRSAVDGPQLVVRVSHQQSNLAIRYLSNSRCAALLQGCSPQCPVVNKINVFPFRIPKRRLCLSM